MQASDTVASWAAAEEELSTGTVATDFAAEVCLPHRLTTPSVSAVAAAEGTWVAVGSVADAPVTCAIAAAAGTAGAIRAIAAAEVPAGVAVFGVVTGPRGIGIGGGGTVGRVYVCGGTNCAGGGGGGGSAGLFGGRPTGATALPMFGTGSPAPASAPPWGGSGGQGGGRGLPAAISPYPSQKRPYIASA
jgi:hypothetical protein